VAGTPHLPGVTQGRVRAIAPFASHLPQTTLETCMPATVYLVEIFLPIADAAGVAFPRETYAGVRRQLVERFEGLTAWSRALAEGVWVDETGRAVRDELIVYEVMAPVLDAAWWKEFRGHLERIFRQRQVLIRAHPVRQL